MRIMTRTQYDAIVDIVTEQKMRISELEAELKKRQDQINNLEELLHKRDESLDYVNEKLFAKSKQLIAITQKAADAGVQLDFPATQKLHEDKHYFI